MTMRIRWLLPFFFVSGFCSLVCEVVWLRLCMATFGCNGAVVSIVLSVFMAGLGLGSYLIARSSRWLDERDCGRALRIYALCEAMIAIGALLVPLLIEQASALLASGLGGLGWASATYYLVSGIMITVIILPWTTFMGATLPLGMAAIRASQNTSERTFSFLYAANLLGATVGTLSSALILIELLGFHGTLLPAALANIVVAASAFALSKRLPGGTPTASRPSQTAAPSPAGRHEAWARSLLFVAGLTTMALEILWFRLYTFYLATSVYAFAKILGLYLVSNFVGSITYRRLIAAGRLPDRSVLLSLAGVASLFALVFADPVHTASFWTPNLRLLAGVAPFAFLSGCLTPLLVDQASAGSPRLAGRAYAWNVVGCIVGPLLASFVLIPLVGERVSILCLAVPYFGYALVSLWSDRSRTGTLGRTSTACLIACAAGAIFFGLKYESIYERVMTSFPDARMLRDIEANTIAFDESPAPLHELLVNGYGMTRKISITKTMAHFPLAVVSHRPQRMLVICFGMGTTFRSAMSWGIQVDAIELIPSVPRMFDVFFPDAGRLLKDPRGHIIIDDGRRFLERSTETYDVITIDPPPPAEAAATSLLYSREFFEAAKRHLRPGGILQHWVPGAKPGTDASILRAANEAFPHIRTFVSLAGWGGHILCSNSPIDIPDAARLASRMPTAAARDFVEWEVKETTSQGQFARLLDNEVNPNGIIESYADALTLTDDRPFNEYFLIREHFPRFWSWWVR